MAIRSGRLGYSFTTLRIFQILLFGAIVALVARLAADVNRINALGQPSPVLWALCVCTLFVVWCLITLFLHVTGKIIRYIVTTVVDALFIPFVVVVAVFLGRPLPKLSCASVRIANHGIENLGDIYKQLPNLNSTFPKGQLYTEQERSFPPLPWAGGLVGLNGRGTGTNSEDLARVSKAAGDYVQWVGRVFSYCITMKIAWALAIVMAVTVIISTVIAFALWRKTKTIPEFTDHDEFETAGVGAPLQSESNFARFVRGLRIGRQIQNDNQDPRPLPASTTEPMQERKGGSPTSSRQMQRSLENRPVSGYSDADSSYEALRLEEEEAREREERRKSSGDVLIPPPPHLALLPSGEAIPASPLASPSRAGSMQTRVGTPSPSHTRPLSELPYPVYPEEITRSLSRPSPPIRRPSYSSHRGYDPNVSGFPVTMSTPNAEIHQYYRPRHQREYSSYSNPYPVYENVYPSQNAHFRQSSFASTSNYQQSHHNHNRTGSYTSLASSSGLAKDILQNPSSVTSGPIPLSASRTSNHCRDDSIADSAISGLSNNFTGAQVLKRGSSGISSATNSDRTTLSGKSTPSVPFREYENRPIETNGEGREFAVLGVGASV